MKVIGVVTLFYPVAEVAENITSYLPELDALIIWDNTPTDHPFSLPFTEGGKIVRIRRGKNTGIGQALNEAADYAIANGFTHLLTMDQDSRFAPSIFEEYLRIAGQCADGNFYLLSPSRITPQGNSNPQVEEIADTIISGSLFPVDTLRRLGNFYATFVMDAIDTEYGLRIHRHGGKIGKVSSVYLQHQLGYPFSKQFLFWKLTSFNYSPMRTYYIARNFIHLKHLYPEYDCKYIIKLFILRRFVRIVCIETNKREKLKALCIGCYHGLTGCMDKDPFINKTKP